VQQIHTTAPTQVLLGQGQHIQPYKDGVGVWQFDLFVSVFISVLRLL
jgi:hypothetical protein